MTNLGEIAAEEESLRSYLVLLFYLVFSLAQEKEALGRDLH
jgi:hypothetical protein